MIRITSSGCVLKQKLLTECNLKLFRLSSITQLKPQLIKWRSRKLRNIRDKFSLVFVALVIINVSRKAFSQNYFVYIIAKPKQKEEEEEKVLESDKLQLCWLFTSKRLLFISSHINTSPVYNVLIKLVTCST